jgi:hypothetical protein
MRLIFGQRRALRRRAGEAVGAHCLAGALSFNLASPENADRVFAQLMLD